MLEINTDQFKCAEPIWIKGREAEKNLFIGFRSVINLDNVVGPFSLRIAGASIYRIYMNGIFVGHGPARAAHAFYRIDVWNVEKYVHSGTNLLTIEAARVSTELGQLLSMASAITKEFLL